MTNQTHCTCNHQTPCTMAFVYKKGKSRAVAQIHIKHAPHLVDGYEALCAGEVFIRQTKQQETGIIDGLLDSYFTPERIAQQKRIAAILERQKQEDAAQ